jgi:hypothetical protein
MQLADEFRDRGKWLCQFPDYDADDAGRPWGVIELKLTDPHGKEHRWPMLAVGQYANEDELAEHAIELCIEGLAATR